jgi:hypothetical protein
MPASDTTSLQQPDVPDVPQGVVLPAAGGTRDGRGCRPFTSVEECREQIRHLVRVRVHRPRGQELEMRAKLLGPCFRDSGWAAHPQFAFHPNVSRWRVGHDEERRRRV